MRREKREGRRGEERNESSSSRVQPLTSPVVRARITRRPAPSIFLGGFLLHGGPMGPLEPVSTAAGTLGAPNQRCFFQLL